MTAKNRRWTPVIRTLNLSLFLSVALLLFWRPGTQARQAETGTLELTILNDGTGEPTPARVEVLDQEGKGYAAEDAIPVDGSRTDRKEPWTGTAQEALDRLNPEVRNHFSGTVHFYSGGSSRLFLPSGSYDVKIRKGFEFETVERRVNLLPGQDVELTLRVPRWADMKAQGWYSADHHLHIARSHRVLDPILSKWMQADATPGDDRGVQEHGSCLLASTGLHHPTPCTTTRPSSRCLTGRTAGRSCRSHSIPSRRPPRARER